MNACVSGCWRTLLIGLAFVLAVPAGAAAAPDPLLADQWALSDPGAIGAQEAWTQSNGAGVLVAVLDTGLQLDHPDLAASVWTNPGEVPGNGRDDDANGIVDDVHGANMFNSSANVNDDNGHGTHVAGIIAARHGNGIGGSGLAPAARIMPVKVLDSSMAGNTDTLARGIRYAVDMGAKILNVSLNGDVATETVTSAVRYAGEHDAVVVASAGNNGRDTDLRPSYPASLPDPAILSVAAQTSEGLLWNLSNRGLLSVDVAAPGEHIASTVSGSSYQWRTGTSAAAPFVAASLALLSAVRPELPMSVLRSTIIDTTRRSNIFSTLLGGGRLDVAAAMHRVLPGAAWKKSAAPVAVPVPAPAAAPARAGGVVTPTLRLRMAPKPRAGTRIALRWSATGAGRVTRWRVSLDGRVVATVPAKSARVSRRIGRAGRHGWTVVGLDSSKARVVAGRSAFRAVARRPR
jgi:subtilisin family serine protease